MTRTDIILLMWLCLAPTAAATAQTTITQRLQQRVAGQGVVNVYQSDSVRQVVDGKPQAKPAAKPDNKPAVKPESKPDEKPRTTKNTPTLPLGEAKNAAPLPIEEAAVDSMPMLNRNALRGGKKMRGFRVQAYAGGNSRRDRNRAEQVKNRVKDILPMEPVYVHFTSPRWTCRVGNYRTYAEAQEVLHAIREAGIEGASIVKSQIVVKE